MFGRKFVGSVLLLPIMCYAVEFNLDVLDAEDRQNIDLSVFSRVGFVVPGRYILAVKANKFSIPEQPILFYTRGSEDESAQACLSSEVVAKLGLKEKAKEKISYWHDSECADFSALSGFNIRNSINEGYIALDIPQAWMEYSDANWVPPSFWDDGLPSLIFDYSVTASTMKYRGRQQEQDYSAYGTAGANLGPWRLRADFRGQYSTESDFGPRFDLSRVYAYRALPSLESNLYLGENYLGSDIFDSFRYRGVALSSDDRMLPPALQGYAPEVRGIAKTNAKVTISQNANILYETTVAAGPFTIQELGSGVRGRLDVRVQEQDGSVQTFHVDTASIPYLTRPGRLRYKVAVGKPSTYEHIVDGPLFGSAELSWGVSNDWSLFGGAIVADKYNVVALGIGRDLYNFGALSFDVSHSSAVLLDKERAQGYSFRLNYAKRFDELDGEVTFAGYRFSQREFMSMDEFLSVNRPGEIFKSNKEMYTITGNKSFSDYNASMYLSYNHQTYWNTDPSERINLTLSKRFNYGSIKDISANISIDRYIGQGSGNGNNIALNLSIPFGSGSSMSYAINNYDSKTNHNISYNDYQSARSNWQISAGIADKDKGTAESIRGYYSYDGDIANATINASHQSGDYWSVAATVRSALTITPEGAALHRQNMNGGTRLMLDTAGVADVPVDGGRTSSNYWGKAVVGDVNSYYRTTASIDVNKLADDVEANNAVVDITLTEGAVGYKKFAVRQGIKLMTTISFADGSFPPFGAQITDGAGREVGLVSEKGAAYLSGVQADSEFTVSWAKNKCRIDIPADFNKESLSTLICVAY